MRMLDRLDAFIAKVLASPIVADAAAQTGRTDARLLLATYANEARIGLDLIEPLLQPGIRILDVGCGIGLLARFLRDEGYDVTGIEPGASGFGFMPTIGRAILSLDPPLSAESWRVCGAEALNPAEFGFFDLIYSTNVLEHIPDLSGAFRGMASVLALGGRMVHLCPNYAVPYEPHFGVPLLPLMPQMTRYLFPWIIRRLPGVWEELNFITAGDVRRHVMANGLQVNFDRGVMASTLRRFDEDPLFRQRQGVIARVMYDLLKATGTIAFVERLPGEWATPMIVRISQTASKARS